MSRLALLGDLSRRYPVAMPVLAGALARLVASVVGYGFHARDDYFHVLEPALRWIDDPSFDWDTSDVPGAGLRSHLVPRAVELCVRALHALGVVTPEAVLRGLHALVGAYSLLVIPALFLLTRRLFDGRTATLAAWLGALHFAMPYAGTRLFIEAMAMPPLVFGLWLVARGTSSRDDDAPRARDVFLGGVLIGLACWFRFQVGAAALGVAAVVALTGLRSGGARRALVSTAALALGGGLAVVGQGLFDLATTGAFLGPVRNNIAYNAAPPAGLTRSHFLTYVGLWVALTVPPATLVLGLPMWRAARRALLVSVPFAIFVIVHSFVPHKEERFMLPVLPLFLALLAAVPGELRAGAGRTWERLRRLWPVAAGWLAAVHGVVLALAVTSQSQANVREAMRSLRQDGTARGVIVLGPEAPAFFLGDATLPIARHGKVDAVWLARALDELRKRGAPANRFVAFAEEGGTVNLLLMALGYDCEPPERFDGWWVDRVIHRVNPKHNRRRSPVLVWSCELPEIALAAPPEPARPARRQTREES